MRKIGILLIILSLILVGCSNGDMVVIEEKPGKEIENARDDKITSKGYVFEANGVEIPMNSKMAPILEKLGESKEYFEAESCAFQGMEKTYTYDGFEIFTYEAGGVDHVASIIIMDDSISTKEGLYLYSDLKEVFDVYGDNYTNNLGLYTYELDKSKISILIEDDEVISIEYTAITE